MPPNQATDLFIDSLVQPVCAGSFCFDNQLFFGQKPHSFFRTAANKRVSTVQLAHVFPVQFAVFWFWRGSWLARFCLAEVSKQIKRTVRKYFAHHFLGNVAFTFIFLQAGIR